MKDTDILSFLWKQAMDSQGNSIVPKAQGSIGNMERYWAKQNPNPNQQLFNNSWADPSQFNPNGPGDAPSYVPNNIQPLQLNTMQQGQVSPGVPNYDNKSFGVEPTQGPYNIPQGIQDQSNAFTQGITDTPPASFDKEPKANPMGGLLGGLTGLGSMGMQGGMAKGNIGGAIMGGALAGFTGYLGAANTRESQEKQKQQDQQSRFMSPYKPFRGYKRGGYIDEYQNSGIVPAAYAPEPPQQLDPLQKENMGLHKQIVQGISNMYSPNPSGGTDINALLQQKNNVLPPKMLELSKEAMNAGIPNATNYSMPMDSIPPDMMEKYDYELSQIARQQNYAMGGEVQQRLGYSQGSPYMNEPYQDFYGNGNVDLTMDNTAIPLMAYPDNGQPRMMPPYSGQHSFPGANTVREVPMAQNSMMTPDSTMIPMLPVPQLMRDNTTTQTLPESNISNVALPHAALINNLMQERGSNWLSGALTPYQQQANPINFRNSKTNTSNPNFFEKRMGGYIPSYQMGGEVPQPMPLQAEAGEMIIFEDGTVTDVNATKSHKKMDKDFITDILPPGAFIASMTKDITMSKADADKFKLPPSPIEYEEHGMEKTSMEEESIADLFFKGKQKLTPADLVKKIKSKYPTVDKDEDIFTEATNDANKESRMPFLELVKAYNTMMKHKKEGTTPEVPMAKYGFSMPNMPTFNYQSNASIEGQINVDPYERQQRLQDNALKNPSNLKSTQGNMGLPMGKSFFPGIPKAQNSQGNDLLGTQSELHYRKNKDGAWEAFKLGQDDRAVVVENPDLLQRLHTMANDMPNKQLFTHGQASRYAPGRVPEVGQVRRADPNNPDENYQRYGDYASEIDYTQSPQVRMDTVPSPPVASQEALYDPLIPLPFVKNTPTPQVEAPVAPQAYNPTVLQSVQNARNNANFMAPSTVFDQYNTSAAATNNQVPTGNFDPSIKFPFQGGDYTDWEGRTSPGAFGSYDPFPYRSNSELSASFPEGWRGRNVPAGVTPNAPQDPVTGKEVVTDPTTGQSFAINKETGEVELPPNFHVGRETQGTPGGPDGRNMESMAGVNIGTSTNFRDNLIGDPLSKLNFAPKTDTTLTPMQLEKPNLQANTTTGTTPAKLTPQDFTTLEEYIAYLKNTVGPGIDQNAADYRDHLANSTARNRGYLGIGTLTGIGGLALQDSHVRAPRLSDSFLRNQQLRTPESLRRMGTAQNQAALNTGIEALSRNTSRFNQYAPQINPMVANTINSNNQMNAQYNLSDQDRYNAALQGRNQVYNQQQGLDTDAYNQSKTFANQKIAGIGGLGTNYWNNLAALQTNRDMLELQNRAAQNQGTQVHNQNMLNSLSLLGMLNRPVKDVTFGQ